MLKAGLAAQAVASSVVGWPYYAADQGASHYSTLADVNRSNVARLAPAWEWRTGEKALERDGTRPGAFEATPLAIGNVLYVTTPYNRVVALDGDTGRELWAFDPNAYADGQPPNGTGFVHRGLAAWQDGGRLRLFLNSRYRLFRWRVPFAAAGAPGVIATAGGVVFVGGGDTALHALDSSNGAELWKAALGRRATATPMTYRSASGRQTIVIATGTGEDAALAAFALGGSQ